MADGDGHSGERNAARHGAGNRLSAERAAGEALPEFVVEDDERVINRHGELSRTGDAQTGYTVCMQTDLPSSLPHALTLGVRGLDESIRFDFDTQTAAMTKGAER